MERTSGTSAIYPGQVLHGALEAVVASFLEAVGYGDRRVFGLVGLPRAPRTCGWGSFPAVVNCSRGFSAALLRLVGYLHREISRVWSWAAEVACKGALPCRSGFVGDRAAVWVAPVGCGGVFIPRCIFGFLPSFLWLVGAGAGTGCMSRAVFVRRAVTGLLVPGGLRPPGWLLCCFELCLGLLAVVTGRLEGFGWQPWVLAAFLSSPGGL